MKPGRPGNGKPKPRPTISVKLDDPTFARPIYCALFKTPDGYVLIWDRPKAKKNGSSNSGGEEF